MHYWGYYPEVALCGLATLDETPLPALVTCGDCLREMEGLVACEQE